MRQLKGAPTGLGRAFVRKSPGSSALQDRSTPIDPDIWRTQPPIRAVSLTASVHNRRSELLLVRSASPALVPRSHGETLPQRADMVQMNRARDGGLWRAHCRQTDVRKAIIMGESNEKTNGAVPVDGAVPEEELANVSGGTIIQIGYSSVEGNAAGSAWAQLSSDQQAVITDYAKSNSVSLEEACRLHGVTFA